MQILYDGSVYSSQAVGGINRYFASLISRMPASVTPVLLTARQHANSFPSHPNLKLHLHPPLRRHKLTSFRRWGERRWFGELTRSIQADLVHPTYYRLLSRREMQHDSRPLVITVYDMIHERFAAALDPRGKHAHFKRQAIERADRIICISEHTKSDLLEMYPIPESKVSVTYLASDMGSQVPHHPGPALDYPYYLYVGRRGGYKNFDRLLLAFRHVVDKHRDLHLCVCGEPFNVAELERLALLGLTGHVVNFAYVDDQQLAALYRGSLALVYPSLYEGFGLPPLEAMSCNTLVVASDRTSIPEVVGDAGLYFDPTSVDELTDRLLEVLNNPALCDVLRWRGLKRERLFNWDRAASQTLDIYRAVCGQRNRLRVAA